MTTKTVRCGRCNKRHRAQPGWNADHIAGLEVGYLCPDCQTAEENLGAEVMVNLVLAPPSQRRAPKLDTQDARVGFIYALVDAYPTPEIMRHKANLLASARKDKQASEMVRLMRQLADDMESGDPEARTN